MCCTRCFNGRGNPEEHVNYWKRDFALTVEDSLGACLSAVKCNSSAIIFGSSILQALFLRVSCNGQRSRSNIMWLRLHSHHPDGLGSHKTHDKILSDSQRLCETKQMDRFYRRQWVAHQTATNDALQSQQSDARLDQRQTCILSHFHYTLKLAGIALQSIDLYHGMEPHYHHIQPELLVFYARASTVRWMKGSTNHAWLLNIPVD
jgi:hypothetical protein